MPRSEKNETNSSLLNLQEHLAQEHKQSPFSAYLKEIVYGGSDGIVTTFAVVAGFTGAGGGAITQYGVMTVLLFGLANLFADGASMGLSDFLSSKSEADVYKKHKKKELYEIRTNPAMEKAETVEILTQKGFSKEQAQRLTEIYATNEDYWVEFMMRDELEMQNTEGDNHYLTALTTFCSFLFFGFIPLIPYVLFSQSPDIFFISIGFTAGALTLLGLLRWRVTGQTLIRSVGEVLLIGGTSAAIAFFVGTFFEG
jgi:VIT1/CCC1 family predicted Fe2+/Mn2+ transporter